MTAIVGVLNSQGVAFAADSAATHKTQHGVKITNHANKIFTISKYHPVGVAVYNNLNFMGIPWETNIKMYRNRLGKKKYDTLSEYIKEFWNFVRANCLVTNVKGQSDKCGLLISRLFMSLSQEVANHVGGSLTAANATQYFQEFMLKMDECNNKFQQNRAEDFKQYSLKNFQKYAKDTIDNLLTGLLADSNCPQEFRKKFEETAYHMLCNESNLFCDPLDYAGLVFFGYGDKEIFPSYTEYLVYYAVDSRIKFKLCKNYTITGFGSSVVSLFAQNDVPSSIIWSIENSLREKFYENNSKSIIGLRDEIVQQMTTANAPQQLIDILNNLDIAQYNKDYKDGMDKYIEENYTKPLVDTVAYLSKEDIAEMAESLVRMTCIKRRITSKEETVGGPVDVAVVTKGDGFIWMQRKHYFDPQLNAQFFERYNM